MKKIFLLCLITVAAAAFVSCSEKEGDVTVNNENLVGRWDLYKTISERGDKVSVEEGYEDEVRQIYEFNADGTGKDIYSEYERGEWHESVINFTYTLHENKIYIVDEEDEEYGSHAYSFTIEKLTANEMVFIDIYENGGEVQISRAFLRRI